MVIAVGDNETAYIDGRVVSTRDNETGVGGVDILLCEMSCAGCVFEGMATSNSGGYYNFPNLGINMYRVEAIGWEYTYDSVSPDSWLVIFRRRE